MPRVDRRILKGVMTMYWFSRGAGVLVVLVLILPSWGQDEKKKKADKPAVEKNVKKSADKDKKTGKRAAVPSKTKKEKAPKDEPQAKVAYGAVFTGKMKSIDPNSQKDFTVELQVPDAQKIYNLNVWDAQQKISLNEQTLAIAQERDLPTKRQRIINYKAALAQYQLGLGQRQNDLTSPKDFELRAAADIKVRTNYPPAEYDDKGNLKRWTMKDLKALKKGSKLPGYPVEYDALRAGQTVAVYLAKPLPASKTKGIKIEDPAEAAVSKRPEVVMIVVVQEALLQR